MKQYLSHFIGLPVLCCLISSLASAQSPAHNDPRELKILVIDQPLTYKKVAGLENGYEYEILKKFARDSDFTLKVHLVANKAELSRLLKMGRGDLGAARISDASGVKTDLAYDDGELALICSKKEEVSFTPEGQLDPSNSFKLFLESSIVSKAWLLALKKEVPKVSIRQKNLLLTPDLFRILEKNKSGCGIVDRLETDYYLPFFRDLRVLKDIPPVRSFQFAIGKGNLRVKNLLKNWLLEESTISFIKDLKSQYKTHFQNMAYSDAAGFLKAKKSRLPRYIRIFKKNARRYGIPWQLVAAVSYQESHWNPKAESYTGVKGMMQLTLQTAEHLGVEDRTNANESIWGGAKYLKMLFDRQPQDIPYRDQLAITLATYNIGPAHMIDAQDIAESSGQDPVDWDDLKNTLPLLGQKKYLHRLRYGPARGHEPVNYVQKVFDYLDLMALRL